MIQLGKKNILKVLRDTSVGMFLGDQEDNTNDVLLPNKYVPRNLAIGEDIEVFVYKDSEDRIVATTLTPLIQLGEFACLQVVAVSDSGAFLNWGLEKDLLVPHRQQNEKLQEGDWAIVYLYLDPSTDRLAASCKLGRYFEAENIALTEGQEVNLLAYKSTDLGLNVVINNQYSGLIYHNEIFKRVAWGDTFKGYIKQIRPEGGGIDVSLRPLGYQHVEPTAQTILEKLKANDGFLGLSDKSDAYDIMEMLEMSKKTFKKAVGLLYKQHLISLHDDGIRLINNS